MTIQLSKLIGHRALLASVLLVLCLFSGCSTFSPMSQKALPTATEPAAATAGQFLIEMHSKFGNTELLRGIVTDKTTVQTVLEEYGAVEKYRTMDIMLYRKVADTGRLLKMPVEYDTRNDQVRLEQDYAIHVNDRLVIKPRSNSALDKLVNTLFGGN